ncbi:50S ribosomal protein L29 [Candidatus Gottesmanbacteria bacterium]|nr:50S ribosomal protein L29 [Candidatus Gottesmanbacteria bacterium]
MKKKEKLSLRTMSDQELTKHVSTLEAEMTKGRVDRVTRQIKNVRTFRAKRTVVAVAKTILRERKLNE